MLSTGLRKGGHAFNVYIFSILGERRGRGEVSHHVIPIPYHLDADPVSREIQIRGVGLYRWMDELLHMEHGSID